MPPKQPNDKSEYKNEVKLYLKKFNGEVQATKVDVTKIKIKTLATNIGVLSEDVKMYMQLFNSKRHYALNGRTIYVVIAGDIGMSATTSETAEAITGSDK